MWGANSWLRVTKEQDNSGVNTYGVYSTKTTPVEGTDFLWVRLDQNNSFTMRPVPAYWTIRSADGGNRRVQTGTSRSEVKGSLNTLFYPTQAGFWLDAALLLTASDLMSYSFEFYDTVKTYRFLGVKVGKLALKCAAMDQIARLTFDLQGSSSAPSPPALAAPASASFPAIDKTPYTHQDSLGLVKINNAVRAKYSSIDLTVDNKLAATWDEGQFITSLFYAGRDVDYTIKAQYTDVADRDALEAATVRITNQLKWTRGANSVTLDLKSSNFVTKVDDDLPLDNAAYHTITVGSLYDRAATTDCSYVVV